MLDEGITLQYFYHALALLIDLSFLSFNVTLLSDVNKKELQNAAMKTYIHLIIFMDVTMDGGPSPRDRCKMIDRMKSNNNLLEKTDT